MLRPRAAALALSLIDQEKESRTALLLSPREKPSVRGGRARLAPKQTCGGAETCGVAIALGLVPPLGDARAAGHK